MRNGPLFESEGKAQWAYPPKGGIRSAGPEEAAEWVDYCNNPANTVRKAHGTDEPYGVRLWQIGNETSYDPTRRRSPAVVNRSITRPCWIRAPGRS